MSVACLQRLLLPASARRFYCSHWHLPVVQVRAHHRRDLQVVDAVPQHAVKHDQARAAEAPCELHGDGASKPERYAVSGVIGKVRTLMLLFLLLMLLLFVNMHGSQRLRKRRE